MNSTYIRKIQQQQYQTNLVAVPQRSQQFGYTLMNQQCLQLTINPPLGYRVPPHGAHQIPYAHATQTETITAPMVGTFYAASSPTESPFVSVGDQVSKGQTICIIEAMKLMNEVEADKDGIIKRIVAENGKMVEFGETLFIIEEVGV